MISKRNLRVLAVDDTVVYRKIISDVVAEIPGVELAGVAHNGKIALTKIEQLRPDILTLDIEMPVMNGLETLAVLKKRYPNLGVIMLSTLTSEHSEITMQALSLGAFDFILKPQNAQNLAAGKREIREALEPILRAYRLSRFITNSQQRSLHTRRTPSQIRPPGKTAPAVVAKKKTGIVVIGVSTGGPKALDQVLPQLPGNIGVPVLIVQHMPPIFTKSLAASLNKKCQLLVKEATDREPVKANTVYIAPGGKQMRLVAAADGQHRLIQITNDPPENSCRPSVDYLFRSVSDYYVGRTTAVIMTGMGSDGTQGLSILKEKGAHIIAQDEASCVVYGMPKAPIELGYADVVAPLPHIAEEIMKTL